MKKEDVMAGVPASVIAAGGLVGGCGVARWTGKRALGGVALAAAGALAAREWNQRAGAGVAAALTGSYRRRVRRVAPAGQADRRVARGVRRRGRRGHGLGGRRPARPPARVAGRVRRFAAPRTAPRRRPDPSEEARYGDTRYEDGPPPCAAPHGTP